MTAIEVAWLLVGIGAGLPLGAAAYHFLIGRGWRGANDRLLDHVLRVQRREAGMPELPRAPVPEPEPFRVPPETEALIRGFESEAVQNAIRTQIRERHANGTPLSELHAELERQLGAIEVAG